MSFGEQASCEREEGGEVGDTRDVKWLERFMVEEDDVGWV